MKLVGGQHWSEMLAEQLASEQPLVMISVAETRGSTPREAGSKMLVTARATFGTIGGGQLEFRAIELARAQLAAGLRSGSSLRRFPLGPSLGQCCGGVAVLLFEAYPAGDSPDWLLALREARRQRRAGVLLSRTEGGESAKLLRVQGQVVGTLGEAALDRAVIAELSEIENPPRASKRSARLVELGADRERRTLLLEPLLIDCFHIVLFGAGHVGRALIQVLAGLPCEITWVDSREGVLAEELPGNVRALCDEFPQDAVAAAPPGSHLLIATHSHAEDDRICRRVLQRLSQQRDLAYWGLIGSASKRRKFEARWRAAGFDPCEFSALCCPIGIDAIPGKQPAEIAIAVAAQLLQRRAAEMAALASESRPRRQKPVADTTPP